MTLMYKPLAALFYFTGLTLQKFPQLQKQDVLTIFGMGLTSACSYASRVFKQEDEDGKENKG